MKFRILIISILASTLLFSCKEEFLTTSPTDATATDGVFSDTQTAWAAVNGLHRHMFSQIYGSQPQGGQSGNMLYMDIYGDDVVFPNVANTWLLSEYRWLTHANPTAASNLYQYGFYYAIIDNANMIINNIDNATGPDADKAAIKAQGLTYRGWAYFQLVQMFGKRYVAGQPNSDMGVPLVLESTIEPKARNTVSEVYAQIDTDLNEAITLFGTAGYTRPNKSHFNVNVAKGIKARVALTKQDWAIAEQFAKEAKQGFPLMSPEQYTQGFNSYENPEWIWSSRIIQPETNFFYSFFAYMSNNYNASVIRQTPKTMFSVLYSKIPSTDIRKTLYDSTGRDVVNFPLPLSTFVRAPYHQKKFRVADLGSSIGDVPYMRASELYLIEAEAQARQNKNAEAAETLRQFVVNRDTQYVLSTKTGQGLIDEILVQRRIELWGEGFRFYDLKRTNSRLDRRGGNHNGAFTSNLMELEPTDNRWQLQIPQQEINRSNNLVVQNPV
jgi:hypothetical protein